MKNKKNEIIIQSGKILSSYNLLCLFHWHKEIMKQPIQLSHLSTIEKILKELDLNYVLSDFFYVNPAEKCYPENENKIIYIWKDIACCQLWKEYDACFEGEFYINHKISEKYTRNEATIGNGKLLWYPDCCVNHFMNNDSDDSHLFHIFSTKLTNYLTCNNYLNNFENFVLHHIPCSFECQKSIDLAKNILPLYIFSHAREFNYNIIDNIISEKTYILFSSVNWIKIEWGRYFFWSYLGQYDRWFEKLKLLIKKFRFEIKIIDEKKILLFNEHNEIIKDDIQVFHFPKIDDKEKILASLKLLHYA